MLGPTLSFFYSTPETYNLIYVTCEAVDARDFIASTTAKMRPFLVLV